MIRIFNLEVWMILIVGRFADSPNHDDEVGKDVAIIVGVIAGIAVVIVLLSLCKQSVSGKK